MKLFLDFAPIVLFFAIYKIYDDLILATAVLIPATVVQVAIQYWMSRKIEPMPLVTLALVVVLGGMTVYLDDPVFIKWKPTLVDALFAIAFAASEVLFGGKPIIQRLMGVALELERTIWIKLNRAWIAFFVIGGVLNLWVAFTMSEATWVNFKLFGMLGLTLVFIVAQGLWIQKIAPNATKD